MGKALIIVLASAIFVSGHYLSGAGRSAYETSEVQSEFEKKIIAQEIATSAFNSGVSKVRRDFENWRQVVVNQPYQGGHYNLSFSGPAGEPVEAVVEGYFGDAWYRINGLVVLSLGDFLDAVTFDLEDVDCTAIGGLFTVSGLDRLPPSAGGGDTDGPDGHAVRALRSSIQSILAGCLPPGQTIGVDGDGDITVGAPPHLYLKDLFLETAALAGTTVIGDTSFTGGTFGSPSSPTVTKIYGDVTFSGDFVGYGLLYVDGSVTMINNARWEGLVMIDDMAETFSLSGNASIYGSVVVRGAPAADPGLRGGHFDVDVYDGPSNKPKSHEHAYDDKYDITYVDLLRNGCGKKADGGLCWDKIIGSGGYAELRAEFFNATSSKGVFIFSADGTTYTGTSEGGLTTTFDPSTVTEFVVNFTELAAMAQTEPKNVKNDVSNRDAAFSVRIYDTSNNEMVYELSVYWHYKAGDTGKECGGKKDKDPCPTASPLPLQFKISGSSGVYYSRKALIRLKDLVSAIDEALDVAVINERVTSSD